jgi:hypothetical protein
MSEISAMQEADLGGLQSKARPRQTYETLSKKYMKLNKPGVWLKMVGQKYRP